MKRSLRASVAFMMLAGGEAARAHAEKTWPGEAGWIAVDDMQFQAQHAEHDCGPTALTMVLDHFCAEPSEPAAAFAGDRRVTAGELRDRARTLGFDAFVIAGTFQDIEHELSRNRPVIVGVAKPRPKDKAIAHYEVVVGIQPKKNRIAVLDPAAGLRETTFAGFLEQWTPTKHLLLVMLPTPSSAPCSE